MTTCFCVLPGDGRVVAPHATVEQWRGNRLWLSPASTPWHEVPSIHFKSFYLNQMTILVHFVCFFLPFRRMKCRRHLRPEEVEKNN